MEAAGLEQLKTALNALLGTGLLGVVSVLCLLITGYTVRLLLSVQTTAGAEKDKFLEKMATVHQEMKATYQSLTSEIQRSQEISKESLRHFEEVDRQIRQLAQSASTVQAIVENNAKHTEKEMQLFGERLLAIHREIISEPLRDSQIELEKQREQERQQRLQLPAPGVHPLPGIPPFNTRQHR